MNNLFITVESTTPISEELRSNNNIATIALTYKMDGVVKKDAFRDEVETHSFYEQLQAGAKPTSDKPKAEVFVEVWKDLLEQGYSILHLSMSSNISETYKSACIARDALLSKYPGKITVVDTLLGGYGITQIVINALELNKNGASVEEIVLWIYDHTEHYNMLLSVDDLNHLRRGGRISNITALLGSALNLKPVLYATSEGKFDQLHISYGSSRLYDSIVDTIEKSSTEATTWVKIQHGGDEHAALELIDKIKSRLKFITHIEVSILSPVLGLHGGPGSLSIYYEGKQRDFLGTL